MSAVDYESEKLLSEYLLFHYGEDDVVLPYAFGPREALRYPQRCAELLQRVSEKPDARGLDLGCAVGRSTFAMAAFCREVIGIDFSRAFIEAAAKLQKGTPLPYEYVVTADLRRKAVARAPSGVDKSRVAFEVGDACELRDDLGTFDAVLGANLLCRLPEPRKLLQRLPELVQPGGWLLFTSPHTWMEEFTPKEHWLAGTSATGHPVSALYDELSPAFTLQEIQEMPFLIRETARKFQWSVAQATLWQRRL